MLQTGLLCTAHAQAGVCTPLLFAPLMGGDMSQHSFVVFQEMPIPKVFKALLLKSISPCPHGAVTAQ